jgi:uncharacterized membrane protein YkoI
MTKRTLGLMMHNMQKLFLIVWLPVMLLLLGNNVVFASDDHETARHLSETGEILPLETILELAQQHQPGRVLEVEFDNQHEQYFYEIEILNTKGIVWELKLDARTGQLLEREQED